MTSRRGLLALLSATSRACSPAVSSAVKPSACTFHTSLRVSTLSADLRLLSLKLSPQAPRFTTSTCLQEVGSPMDTQGSSGTSADLSEKDFHRHADLSIGDLYGKLEEVVEEAGLPEADLEYSQGVLTLELGKHGTYVINKQGPNKQLWMSSPVSGPVRYDWQDGLWQYKHDGHKLHQRLQTELRELLNNRDIDLEPEPVIGYGPDVT
ncbi:MAG: frataxin mitochondrial-like [Trebouxia sp. A1-2]|nr:MAG: frataxin mitochondrial-like [Trebouxia sp. A1-2]